MEHNWGEWIITAPALLNKDGTETRTCKVCSATETKVTKENAVENAFTDVELQYLFDRWNGVNGDITASGKVGLSKDASVKGNITAAAIGVEVGAKIEGSLSIK